MAKNDVAAATVDEAHVAALNALVEVLGGRDRKARQSAAHTIAEIAKGVPEVMVPHAAALAAAVGRPEAQTRWEALEALTAIVSVDPEAASAAFEGAEEALYDEESGLLRLTAFRYLAVLGASSPAWSAKVWPLVDEAIQCYHGDPEFDGMLDALYDFAQSDLDPAVRSALADRMRFDAGNSRGYVATRARQIIERLG